MERTNKTSFNGAKRRINGAKRRTTETESHFVTKEKSSDSSCLNRNLNHLPSSFYSSLLLLLLFFFLFSFLSSQIPFLCRSYCQSFTFTGSFTARHLHTDYRLLGLDIKYVNFQNLGNYNLPFSLKGNLTLL